MKTIKIEKRLALQEYRKWDGDDLPQYAIVNKVTGKRNWYWSIEDATDSQEFYGTDFYDTVKIKWI